MKRSFAALAAAILLCASPALAQQLPLRTGVDGTFAPHAFPKLGGGIQGFQIDLFTEVAKRMKREITIDSVSFSTLIPGMQSGRYDFVAAPTTVTKERAEQMLFTAGYLWTASSSASRRALRRSRAGRTSRARRSAVNKGTPYETLSKTRRPRRSASRCRPTTPSPTPRRRCCRAAPMRPSAAIRSIVYTARRTRSSSPTSSSRTRASIGRRRPARTMRQLRNQLQDAIDCMKKDGTIAELSEKWFGDKPEADDLGVVITPGYGVPGMPGYDPTPHEPAVRLIG